MSWKSKCRYEQDRKAAGKRAKPTDVVCPICGALRGIWCVFPDTARRRKHPHPERYQKAKRWRAERMRRSVRIRQLRAQRWETVTVTLVCPVCGGDHLRADHTQATDTLLERARASQLGERQHRRQRR